MVTIAQALARGNSGTVSVDETALSLRFEAELLLMNALGCNRASLLTWPEREIDPAALASFEQALNRRLAGEPIAYILGKKEFWDFDLIVSPAVLIPRPETELLVELRLKQSLTERGFSIYLISARAAVLLPSRLHALPNGFGLLVRI